jgi:hypothetical protein
MEVAARRYPHADLDGLKLVGVLEAGRALDVQDGVIVLGVSDEKPVADDQARDARPCLPAARGREGRWLADAAGRRRRRRERAAEPPFRPQDARRLGGARSLDLLRVEPLDQADGARPRLGRPAATWHGDEPDCGGDRHGDGVSPRASTHRQGSNH